MINSQSCVYIAKGKSEAADENEFNPRNLHEAIARAISEGWQIAPVSAHSKFASLTRSCIEAPSNEPAQIVRWTIEYPESNWCVATGRDSKLAILEVNHEIGQESLCELCNDDWEKWTATLQFQDDRSSFLLFRYAGQRLRFLPSQYKGIKIHAGTLVLLPPSWFVTGNPLDYSDLDAAVLDCPKWVLAPGESQRNASKVIPFPTNPLHSIA